MTKREWRATWVGAGIAVIGSILFAVIAHALEPTINGPGTRNVAPPVLWGLGGALGLALGAFVASFGTRRFWPGAQAAFFGALAFLVLVIFAYNNKTLHFEDQVVGSLIVVVLPAFLAGLLAAWVGKIAGRVFGRGHPATSPPATPPARNHQPA
jgi:drug/metabolite transporter (DMT)-like permease